MAACQIVDALPEFLVLWESIQYVDAARYIARWADGALGEHCAMFALHHHHAADGEDRPLVASRRAFPYPDRCPSAMRAAHYVACRYE
ncbi:MAG: hypothetical protein GX620_08760 [Chloroflexi bacterium]|nr:hypothetical protein [Chloroflexota bacterium]